jgi:predicted sugar kinase
MQGLTRYMDRYYLDALIGVIPGWGDAIALLSALPFVYFSARIIKSVPLTLAVVNNALRDVLMGMIPFFVGDIIDIFHRSNIQNMQMVQGFVDGDEAIIRKVNQRALQSAVVLALLLLLIALMIWALVSFGSYLYSLVV